MSRRPMKRLALALALLAGGGVASAQDLLIRNATVRCTGHVLRGKNNHPILLIEVE